jgi:predicted metal-dependent enzyme (double-stranded beta helix superfamily)
MFDKDQFVADCQAALAGLQAAVAVRELVARSVSEPAAVMRGLGEPRPGGIDILHRSPELTILNLIWPANMIVMPHDHRMWSVIGIYDGREDNILWRRLPDRTDGRIEAAGAKSISTGETVAFGADIIHSVVNPISPPAPSTSMAETCSASNAVNGTPTRSAKEPTTPKRFGRGSSARKCRLTEIILDLATSPEPDLALMPAPLAIGDKVRFVSPASPPPREWASHCVIDLLRGHLEQLEVPILGGLPVGHGHQPQTTLVGAMAVLDSASGTLTVHRT